MSEPKTRPILFSGPMVKALLEGRKSQTRRTMKPQPVEERDSAGEPIWTWKHNGAECPRWPGGTGMRWERFGCPHGVAGDKLWVRETWQRSGGFIRYNADGAEVRNQNPDARRFDYQLRPSIHMPRWASRLTLEITEVRVERLQDISEEDAKAEGVRATDAAVVFEGCGHYHDSWDQFATCPNAKRRQDLEMAHRGAFSILWDSINGKRGFGWGANPWVWVLTFKVVPPEPLP